jgi:hypothetical protein
VLVIRPAGGPFCVSGVDLHQGNSRGYEQSGELSKHQQFS